MALIHTLRDDFSTNTLAANWPGSVGATITGGRMRVTCDTGFNKAQTAASYTLDGSKVCVQAFPSAAGAATTEATTELLVTTTTAGTDAGISYNAVTGLLTFSSRSGFFDGAATTLTYNATTHRWWRMRVTSGTLFWETSPDGDTWTTRRSASAPAWVSNANLAAALTSHRNNGTNDFAEFDLYNMATVSGVAVLGTTTVTPTATGKRKVNGVAALGTITVSPAINGIHRTVHGVATLPLHLSLTALGDSPEIAYPPPAPTAFWRFLTGGRAGGYQQELTAATGRKLTARLVSPSEVGFSLDARLPQAANVDEMVTDVHVLWTSKLDVTHRLFRGRVGSVSDTGTEDSHTMSVTALDYRAVVARRYLEEGRAANLNAGFQDGTGFWSGTGGLLEVDDTEAQVGKRSGRITPDGVTATVLIAADDFAATAGTDYRVTGWARCAVAKTITYKVTWKNAAHGTISDDDITLNLDAETWTRLELDATSPALTAYASIALSMTGTPAATDLLWLDEGRLSTAPYQQSRLRFDQVDQAEIAWQLIQDTQARVAGDLGISPAWSGPTPTGELRDREYELGDSIGERIQQLSEVIDGFNWDILPVSASGLQLQVWHPERGANRGVVLEYGGLVTRFNRQVNPSEYANAIRQTGADNLDAQEREAEDLATQPAGRWGGVYADTSLTTQQAVNDRAHWQMKESQFIQPTWTVTLKPDSWLGPDHIWLGDLVRLIVYSGRLTVDTTLRVFEMAFDIADDGSVAIEVTLGGRAPDLRRFRSLVERRLTTLERR